MSQTPAKPEPSEDTSAADRGLNRAMLGKLAVVVVMMFGFGYALVPLYKKICEVTNINVLTTRDYDGGALRNTQVDQTRTITVEFDSNSQGPFRFRPVQNSMEVHPGEISQIVYEVVNKERRTVEAQAIPSYAPKQATEFFKKIECFCFKQQTLAANESREMPVVFVIDPDLPKDVKTITLSYTFFEIGKPVAQAPTVPGRGT
ncbi:cytochrome c oxidase assembly protein [Ralstonia mannitolilytica]|uniref:Cytochrome c oxidase assembly protein CtaG n=1 Tax=Ralstonia mannitolilytica TaxID=105219 RepID=A0AAJ4ZJ06_9RALS|nr:cytochrome c oxidase assembly protein [Ralstonia mannitolilytica]CAG2152220.1 Cytochrome c oxidase assembly protein CtaG [Ralstonia mannitolilytica]CAJ0736387.1 Cytochrome c oxidase assembly protein CtaG [Ralstonia mannitolilytica]SUD86646.1 Cytochrome c oxidase assembly protein CtaG [Ralstonia mannitolilytica]SUD92584.1 Cytochrome c oxidase assembly protein CtaG [Ralstonia mannitolilytica]SUD96307.1 Cytochrome c oxidase assembly protein CtaG [Ralstonia mannitolilytica]